MITGKVELRGAAHVDLRAQLHVAGHRLVALLLLRDHHRLRSAHPFTSPGARTCSWRRRLPHHSSCCHKYVCLAPSLQILW